VVALEAAFRAWVRGPSLVVRPLYCRHWLGANPWSCCRYSAVAVINYQIGLYPGYLLARGAVAPAHAGYLAVSEASWPGITS